MERLRKSITPQIMENRRKSIMKTSVRNSGAFLNSSGKPGKGNSNFLEINNDGNKQTQNNSYSTPKSKTTNSQRNSMNFSAAKN